MVLLPNVKLIKTHMMMLISQNLAIIDGEMKQRMSWFVHYQTFSGQLRRQKMVKAPLLKMGAHALCV